MEDVAILAGLRATLDGIDDALHDLLIRRAEVVTKVAARKAASGAAGRLRPGREAAILRRLLARHHGPLPAASIVRVWREVLAGSVAMQGDFAVAVAGADLAPVAREQFGALTPLCLGADAAHALAAVQDGDAAVAVLPMPEADRWWQDLAPGLFVVARLPFWRARPAGAPGAEALVIAAAPPDASGDDLSLLLVPDGADPGGFTHVAPVLRTPGGRVALATVAGFVAPGDERLAPVAGARVLGAYARPVG